jgi:glycosyltransferase involved in cell wall biosynthesis
MAQPRQLHDEATSAIVTTPSGESGSPPDADLLAALLANAREERDDTHQQLVESQAWINSVLAHPLYRGLRRGAHLVRLRRGEVQQPEVTAPPELSDLATGAIDPQALLVDATALTESMRSGIARVTIRVFTELTERTATQLVVPTSGGLRRAEDLERDVLGSVPSTQPTPGAYRGLFSAGVVPGPYAQDWWRSVDSYRRGGGRYAQVVHDVLPITMPEFFDRNLREYFPLWLGQVLTHADVVFTDSAATLDNLRSWARDADTVAHQVQNVLPLGSDFVEVPSSDVSTPADNARPATGPHVLVVGTIEPRKGVEAMLDAIDYLRGHEPSVTVTFCGARGWIAPSVLERLETTAAQNPQVRWERQADDNRLAQLYQDADLLVAPSRGEGYGLPIVEALAHHTPVLARDIAVFREIGGDKISYFDSDAALGPAIVATLADPVKPPQVVATPAWSHTAETVLAALNNRAPETSSG